MTSPVLPPLSDDADAAGNLRLHGSKSAGSIAISALVQDEQSLSKYSSAPSVVVAMAPDSLASLKRKSMSIGNLTHMDLPTELESPVNDRLLSSVKNIESANVDSGLQALSEDQGSQDEKETAPANQEDLMQRIFKRFLRHFPELRDDIRGHVQVVACDLARDRTRWCGRMFATDNHLCFHGKLGTKAAKITITWRDIILIELKPAELDTGPDAGVKVMTLNSKYHFVGIADTEMTFNLLDMCWKNALDTVKREAYNYNAVARTTPERINSPITPGGAYEIDTSRYTPELSDGALSDSAADMIMTMDGKVATMTLERRTPKLAVLTSERSSPTTTLTDMNIVTHPIVPIPSRSNIYPITNATSTLAVSPTQAGAIKTTLTRTTASTSGYSQSTPIDDNSTPQARRTTVNDLFQRFGKRFAAVNGASNDLGSTTSSVITKDAKQGTIEVSLEPALTNSVAPLTSVEPMNAQTNAESAQSLESTVIQPLVKYPFAPTTCGCNMHYKHTILDDEFDVDVQDVWSLLFDGDSQLFRNAHARRETENIQYQNWTLNTQTSLQERVITFKVSFSMPLQGKKTATCFETQAIVQKEDFVLVMDSLAKTPDIIYGEYFNTVSRVCVTYIAPRRCRLMVTFKVNFQKSLMWEGKIERSSVEGGTAFWKELAIELRNVRISTEPKVLPVDTNVVKQTGVPKTTAAIIPPPTIGIPPSNMTKAVLATPNSPPKAQIKQNILWGAILSLSDSVIGSVNERRVARTRLRRRGKKLLRQYNTVFVIALCLLTLANMIGLYLTSRTLSRVHNDDAASNLHHEPTTIKSLNPSTITIERWLKRVSHRIIEARNELEEISDVLNTLQNPVGVL